MACMQAQQRLKTFSALSAHLSRSSKPRSTFLASLPLSHRNHASSTASLSRVTQPSLWHSIVPKFLRTPQTSNTRVKNPKQKEWNPATFFIIIFLLIGSNAIQMIALKHEFTNFNRKANAQIGLLKDVLGRLQRGEDVDVEGLLGTGDKEKEREWEDVLHEIEEEDRLWQSKAKDKQRERKKAMKEAKEEAVQEPPVLTPEWADISTATPSADTKSNDKEVAAGAARPGFY